MSETCDQLRIIVEPLSSRVTTSWVVRDYLRSADCAILESSRSDGPFARYSIFADDAVGEVRIPDRLGEFQSLMDELSHRLIHVGDAVERADSFPFVGGWIGYLSYDAAEAGLQKQYADRHHSLPLAQFRLYDTVAIHDNHTNTWFGVAVDWSRSTGMDRPSVRTRLNNLVRRFAQIEQREFEIGRLCRELPSKKDNSQGLQSVLYLVENELDLGGMASIIRSDWSRDGYLRAVERVLEYIADGDVYQVNLAQRFTTSTSLTPIELFLRLRGLNPSSHAAFLATNNAAIISSSPELFLDLRNRHVVTRPIKGTRPRGENEWSDRANCAELEASEKDHAELAMIVDLMRNDLNRVCEIGTVRVSDPGTIEMLPTVFHRTATVEGDLKPGQRWNDLLMASFPGGSITGAPKIRAMQIIHELEPVPRGVYCGSIGYVGLDGSMSMNIAIRTMTQVGGTVHIHAGSGIVADSEPEAEHAEIMAKARAMFHAVGCDTLQHTCIVGAAS